MRLLGKNPPEELHDHLPGWRVSGPLDMDRVMSSDFIALPLGADRRKRSAYRLGLAKGREWLVVNKIDPVTGWALPPSDPRFHTRLVLPCASVIQVRKEEASDRNTQFIRATLTYHDATEERFGDIQQAVMEFRMPPSGRGMDFREPLYWRVLAWIEQQLGDGRTVSDGEPQL